MPITRYQKAVDFLKEVYNEKQQEVMLLSDFLNEIALRLGADENRTVRPYVKLMLDLGLIEKDKNPKAVKINFEKLENGNYKNKLSSNKGELQDDSRSTEAN